MQSLAKDILDRNEKDVKLELHVGPINKRLKAFSLFYFLAERGHHLSDEPKEIAY